MAKSQDTLAVQTITFDSIGRIYMFNFPDGYESYRKVIMQYKMRCHGGLVSSRLNPNLGCGEWDYSCNTMLTDSSRTDSVKSTHQSYIISGFSGTTFNYKANPTYYQSIQEAVTYTATNSETVGTSISSGTISTN